MTNTDKEKLSLNEGRLSLFGNILLFGIKLWAGLSSASSALIADAWHTLSDSISSLVIIIAAKISNKKADKEHPFGHGRAELIAALIVGVLLCMIALEFFIEGIHRLGEQQEAQYGILAIVITLVSVIVKELMAQYALFAYRKCECLSLKADAWHHRSDAISSLVLLVGVIFGRSIWWMDGILTLIVSVLITWTAYHIIRDGVKPLMGEAPDDEMLTYISNTCDQILNTPCDVHHLHLHRYGDHIEITFHLLLPPDISLKEAHDLITKIEHHLRKDKNIEATIHPEPHAPKEKQS